MRKYLAILIIALFVSTNAFAELSRRAVPPSYHNGYARNASISAFPQAWKGLIGIWAPFLGPTGTTLRDVSGYGNHGTFAASMDPATDWLIGGDSRLPGYVIRNTGDGDQVSFNGPSGLQGRPQGTIIAHAANTGLAGEDWLVGERGGGEDPFQILLRGNELVRLRIRTATTDADVSSTFVLADTDRHQFVWHYDGIILSLYFDGIFDASTAVTGAISTNEPGFFLGHDGTSWWDGKIHSLSIYDRALTPAEIAIDHQYPAAALWLREDTVGFVAAVAAARRIMTISKLGFPVEPALRRYELVR